MNAQIKEDTLRSCVHSIRVFTPSWELSIERFYQWMSAARVGCYKCALILGESGTGKSKILEHLASLFPAHREVKGMVRPVLIVEMPHHATAVSILQAILHKLGDPHPGRGNRDEKMRRVGVLMDEQGVKIILLDDFQHLVDKGQDVVLYESAECLKEILITKGVGIVAAGLEDARKVILSDEQLIRRSPRPILVPRYDWSEARSQDEFVGLLTEMQRRMPDFDLPELDHPDMALRLYLASGGLLGYLADILAQATWDAIDQNRRKIAMKDLARARDAVIFDDTSGGGNPFSTNFKLYEDHEHKVEQAKLMNRRVERPNKRQQRRNKGMLARVGL